MTKAELVKKISRETGVETVTVSAIVESAMENIRSSVTGGEPVFLRGFGTFRTKVRRAKPARIISQRKTLIVPEHKIPVFKPCDSFKDAVKG